MWTTLEEAIEAVHVLDRVGGGVFLPERQSDGTYKHRCIFCGHEGKAGEFPKPHEDWCVVTAAHKAIAREGLPHVPKF